MNTHRTPQARSLASLLLVTLMVLASLAALSTATPASAAARSLQVSPSNYIGGQNLTWTGNVGTGGVRKLRLQFNMARPGDTWNTIKGFSSRTNADGSFRFTYPAPSMFGVLYRVKAGRFVSAVEEMNAKTPEVTLEVTGQGGGEDGAPGLLDDNERFSLTANTAPTGIFRAPESAGLPVFPGRALTLYKRITGDNWAKVATTTANNQGVGVFTGLTEPAGIHAYRVRQEAITTQGNKIGWNESFPLHLYVGRDAQQTLRDRIDNAPRSAPVDRAPSSSHAASPTAAAVNRWFPILWDFDWESGQALDAPSKRGTNKKARWSAYSDGSGRVFKHNGGIILDSKRYNGPGHGDHGTTRATLNNAGLTQGRWEARLRIRSAYERGGNQYNIVAELIPARAADYACGTRNITIAKLDPFSADYQYGVRNKTTKWTATKTTPAAPTNASHGFAVELRKDRITWYLNGKPVGTVKDRAAIPTVPMTLRLSLEGQGQNEMDQVSLISDWQRGYPHDSGNAPVSSNKLKPTTASTPSGC